MTGYQPKRKGNTVFVIPFNEIDLLKDYFADPMNNHGLSELIGDFRFIDQPEDSVGIFPAVYFWTGDLIGIKLSEPDIDYDAASDQDMGVFHVAQEFQWNVDIQIVILKTQTIEYNGIAYSGNKALYVIRAVLLAMLSEFDYIESEDGTTIISSPRIFSISPAYGWEGTGDASFMSFKVQFDLQHRLKFAT